MTERKGKTAFGRSVHLAGAFIGLVCAALLCGGQPLQAASDQSGRRNCVNVSRATVKASDFRKSVTGIGSLRADQRVVVRPEVAGTIKEVHFQEGEKVDAGQVLFQLERVKLEKQLKARQAALQEAKANLRGAERTFRRQQQLCKRDLTSEEVRDQAQTAYEMAQAKVTRLQAEIQGIKERLEDTSVQAPFAGFIGERMVDRGEWVDIGTGLATMVQVEKLEIAFTLPERYLGQVKEGQPVRTTVQAFPDKVFSGRVFFLDPVIQDQTRSLQVKATVDNTEGMLRPGGFGQAKVIVDTHRDAAVIPEEALVPTRSGYRVFVLENSEAHLQKVEVGLRRPGQVEIVRGLEPGQRIVRAGHINLSDGAAVCPAE